MSIEEIKKEIQSAIKDIPEQKIVVAPIVERLVNSGWNIHQIIFGKNEWKVPKTPSEASKREKGSSFDFFPVDIAVFDSVENCGDYKHLLFIIECKQPKIDEGLQQLEIYLGLEPHVKLGIWVNKADDSAETLFVHKNAKGLSSPKRKLVKDIPSFGSEISESAEVLTFNDLVIPSQDSIKKQFEDILDQVVAQDGNVTRREQQLDQFCDLLLLKLDSDKHGNAESASELNFRPLATPALTASHIKKSFLSFIEIFPDVFTNESDRELRFNDTTIHDIVQTLSKFNLIDISADAISIAFQVLRSAALKEKEGQFFTPRQVIQAAVKLMRVEWNDILIDPACGTGGFLIQSLIDMKERFSDKYEMTRWAQLHLFGIDKDSIGIKLTKAVMQILGDGSAHCVRGDSVLTNIWKDKYPHLLTNEFKNSRFTKLFTNPPFGNNLKLKYSDLKKSSLSLLEFAEKDKDIELGLAMFNRCCDLLQVHGRMCIVLPETYFFSPSYKFVRDWQKKNLKPICVANVPMDAFQGFCRAKTNIYVFEKIAEDEDVSLDDEVVFLNPKTCGIYKNGSDRFVVDSSGKRTTEIDNELYDMAVKYGNAETDGFVKVPLREVYEKDVLVPSYYDKSFVEPFFALARKNEFEFISIKELIETGIITLRGGHGSPSNDLRNGTVPYIKVSDIRNLRINVNPSNLIPEELAKKFWRTKDGKSDLKAWDLISPNRASANIGEFTILLPGEEQVVLTKEMFVIRVNENVQGYTPFYLLWAFTLKEIREQWRRITLMQTNREDVGERYNEILIPKPKSVDWAEKVSMPFSKYFKSIAGAKNLFSAETAKDEFNYIASVSSFECSNCKEETALLNSDVTDHSRS